MPAISRNAPCPCGSGKKYKVCHLPIDTAAARTPEERAEATHALDNVLVEQMTRFARARYGDAFDPLGIWNEELGGSDGESNLQIIVPWALFHLPVAGTTVARAFLDDPRNRLSAQERSWLEACLRSWMTVWEVTGVAPGASVMVEDLLTGETRLVIEKSGSKTLSPRDTVLGRVVDHDAVSVFCGIHPRPLRPGSAADVVRDVRRILRATKRRPPSVERFRDPETVLDLLALWNDTVGMVDEEYAAGLLPALSNTDGDELVMTSDRFRVAAGARRAVEERLGEMEGAAGTASVGGATVVSFVKPGNRLHRGWDNTAIGEARVGDGELEVETNSVARADALRSRIEAACGDLVRHRERTLRTMASLLADVREGKATPEGAGSARGAAPEESAEMSAALRGFKEKHYDGWLDTPLPALSGRTPREAAKKPRTRAKVVLMLKEIENMEGRLPPADRFDVSRLWRALGLSE